MEYHDSEVGPWDCKQCLVAFYRTARVGITRQVLGPIRHLHLPNQTCLLISLDPGTSSGRRRRRGPLVFALHREQEWKTWRRMAHSTLSSGSHRSPWLAVHVCSHTVLLSMGLQLHHGLATILLLRKEFGRGNGEQLLDCIPSTRADPAYSLLPILYLFLMCFILSCVDPPVCRASVPVLLSHPVRSQMQSCCSPSWHLFCNSAGEGACCILARVHVIYWNHVHLIKIVTQKRRVDRVVCAKGQNTSLYSCCNSL